MRFLVFNFLFLFLLGSTYSTPISKRHFNAGKLSSNPPSKGFGQAQYGEFNNFNPQINDVNILQFALMLEVNILAKAAECFRLNKRYSINKPSRNSVLAIWCPWACRYLKSRNSRTR
jgi:hypothetical protein